VYGKNIAAWDDKTALADAPTLWRGKTGAGQALTLRGLTVQIAEDAPKGTRIEITSANGASAPALFAATWEGE